MDGWYLGDSLGWFGSILSVDSPHPWATVCSLRVEPTSVLCSSRPPQLKGLASLQPAIAFCPVPSHGPHRTFGMKSARNKWPPMHNAIGTGVFMDSDAARPGPLDLPCQDSLDTSPSTDFCHHSPLRAGGLSLHKLSRLLSLQLWLMSNTQA